MSNISRAEATALMMASLCISVVKDDPELIKRLRKLAKKTGAPVEDNQAINEVALALVDLAITAMALRAAKGGGFADNAVRSAGGRHERSGHEGHAHEMIVLPVPNGSDGAAASAGALSIGSFAVEYLHKVPGVREAFTAWLNEAHPKATDGAVEARQEQLVAADQQLTLMAHIAGKIADGEIPAP